jgi:hypothetical protein
MHVRDVIAEEAYVARRDSGAVAAVELGGARTVLSVPLLNKGGNERSVFPLPPASPFLH